MGVVEFRKVNGRDKVCLSRSDTSEKHIAAVAEGLRQSFATRNGRELKNFREVTLPAEMVDKFQRLFIQECRKLQALHPEVEFSGGPKSITSLTRAAHPDLFELMQTERCAEVWDSDVEIVS